MMMVVVRQAVFHIYKIRLQIYKNFLGFTKNIGSIVMLKGSDASVLIKMLPCG
jgi:hypothetical protein